MDLNGDGATDILSGSYSRMDKDMAGLFQVLWGNADGTFRKAEPLQGSNGELLIIAGAGQGDDVDLDKICTRPFAADLNGDGKLDLVAGNFRGTFAFFAGEGDGKFAPTNSWLRSDTELLVPAHSDPFLIDWDGDGDLDLLTGSSEGGAFLFTNTGSKTGPQWAARVTLVEPHGHGHLHGGEIAFGEQHIKGPQGSTRIWVDDVDGDGLLDLLLGDMVTVNQPAKGLDEATARKQHAEWNKKLEQVSSADTQDQDAFQRLWAEQEKIIKSEMTGFVWLLRQKAPAAPGRGP